jgi:hypothetical protein
MLILVACEESQALTIELRRLGHKSFSCDIEPCSGGHPEWHIQQDVLPLINGHCEFATMDGVRHTIAGRWDMLFAFPPCTYLSNAGACRLYSRKGQINQERYEKGLEAKAFFMRFYNADCSRIVIENPMPSTVYDLPKHTQDIQPYQFDPYGEHPYTKKTRIWTVGEVDLLIPTTPDKKAIGSYVPAGTGRKDRTKYGYAKRGDDAKNRSKTFHGIAVAMAEQLAAAALAEKGE